MMEIIQQMLEAAVKETLPLPAIEVTALIMILTVCLLFKFTRVGLVVAYLFAYRWGWIFFLGQSTEMMTGYLIFGCLTGVLTVVGMMRSS